MPALQVTAELSMSLCWSQDYFQVIRIPEASCLTHEIHICYYMNSILYSRYIEVSNQSFDLKILYFIINKKQPTNKQKNKYLLIIIIINYVEITHYWVFKLGLALCTTIRRGSLI